MAAVSAAPGRRPRWRRKAGTAAASTSAVAVLVAGFFGGACLLRRGGSRGCASAFTGGRGPALVPALGVASCPSKQGRRQLDVGLRAQVDDVAEAKAALEVAKLELQAVKLRAEAEEMERANLAERRATRARQLLGEGRSDQATVDLETLRVNLKEELGLKVEEDRVRWLMDSGKQGAEALGFDVLRSEAFQAALDRLVADSKDEERRAALREREVEMREQRERRAREPEETSLEPAEVNDDRSMGTRILGSLAYVLPLLDGLQFGAPLMQYLPFLTPFFAILSIPNSVLNAIPFGSLICFFILTVLANNRELPRLLRFNIQQAVLLDVALFIPSLLASLLSFGLGNGGAGAGEGVGVAVFAVLTIAILYSVVLTLLGEDPDGLPVISDATRRGIDRPNV